MKNIRIFIFKLSVFGGEIFFIYLNRQDFVMVLLRLARKERVSEANEFFTSKP